MTTSAKRIVRLATLPLWIACVLGTITLPCRAVTEDPAYNDVASFDLRHTDIHVSGSKSIAVNYRGKLLMFVPTTATTDHLIYNDVSLYAAPAQPGQLDNLTLLHRFNNRNGIRDPSVYYAKASAVVFGPDLFWFLFKENGDVDVYRGQPDHDNPDNLTRMNWSKTSYKNVVGNEFKDGDAASFSELDNGHIRSAIYVVIGAKDAVHVLRFDVGRGFTVADRASAPGVQSVSIAPVQLEDDTFRLAIGWIDKPHPKDKQSFAARLRMFNGHTLTRVPAFDEALSPHPTGIYIAYGSLRNGITKKNCLQVFIEDGTKDRYLTRAEYLLAGHNGAEGAFNKFNGLIAHTVRADERPLNTIQNGLFKKSQKNNELAIFSFYSNVKVEGSRGSTTGYRSFIGFIGKTPANDRLTLMICPSDQLVPFGYVKNGTTWSPERNAEPIAVASQAPGSWIFLGTIYGPPPYAPNGNYDQGQSRINVRIEKTNTEQLKLTNEVSYSINLDRSFVKDFLSVEAAFSHSLSSSDTQIKSDTITQNDEIISSPTSAGLGRLYFLKPTLKVTALKAADWQGNLLGEALGKPDNLVIHRTEVDGWKFSSETFDMRTLEGPIYRQGLKVYQNWNSSRLGGWSEQESKNQYPSETSTYRTSANMGTMDLKSGSGTASISKETSLTQIGTKSWARGIQLSVLFGGVGPAFEGSVSVETEISTNALFEIEMSQAFHDPKVSPPDGKTFYERYEIKPHAFIAKDTPGDDHAFFIPAMYKNGPFPAFCITYSVEGMKPYDPPVRLPRETARVATESRSSADAAASSSALPATPAATTPSVDLKAPVPQSIGEAASPEITHTAFVDWNGPLVLVNPQDESVTENDDAEFYVTAIDPLYREPVSYQWRRNGQPVSGETGALLHISRVQEDSNRSVFDVEIWDTTGRKTLSAPAVLNVLPASRH